MSERILVAVFLHLLLLGVVIAQDTKTQDSLKIVSVSAMKPVENEVSNEFAVQIEYTLESADEAMIAIGFNTERPGTFKMVGQKKIAKGSGIINLKASVIPKDWKERGDFMVLVNIMPYPINKNYYIPTVSDNRVIEFEN